MGDFNINLLDHNFSPPVENFINQMISKNFLPIINRPIRVTPHSCTLIDNIFCNRVDEVESPGVVTTNIYDHYPVFARENFPTLPEDSISINYRVFSDENLSNFKNSLQDINWNPVLINDDADEAYDLFQSTLLSVFNEHFPIHTKNISSWGKSKPWITPDILAAIRMKRRLKKSPPESRTILNRMSQAQKFTH